jgi:hypothetical protein
MMKIAGEVEAMKKTRKRTRDRDEMRSEYDFSKLRSRPNPYAKAYARGTNFVLLDQDNAKVFRDSESVNRALRALRDAASAIPQKSKRTSRRKGAA